MLRQQRQRDGLAHRPHRRPQQRHVDDRRLARALAVEQRAHHPAGDRHRADRVAEARAGRAHDVPVLRTVHRRSAMPDAGPEGQAVVRALVGVGTPLALPGAPHVDDVRVVQPGSPRRRSSAWCARSAACWSGRCPRSPRAGRGCRALVGGQVETEALLAAVRVLEQRVHVTADRRPRRSRPGRASRRPARRARS